VEITFLGHAGLFIETRYGTILCDPWFNPAYFASWFPFPSNEEVEVAKFSQPTYLYISHMHYDHFDPQFLREHVWKEAIVLLPDYPLDHLERALHDVGFKKFIRTKNGQAVDVDGLRFMIMAMVAPMDGAIGDSGLIVDDGEVCIFDQNDSRPVDLDLLTSFGPYDAHFVQFSGAVWFPMVYQFPEKMVQALGRKKRENEMARALRYIQQLNAAFVIPSAGPPCFLDDHQFHMNDFDRDPSNTFPDETVFLEYMQSHDLYNGHLMIPSSVATLGKGACSVVHPQSDEQVRSIFSHKRTYLEAYKARKQPLIDALRASWVRGQVDILSSLRDWFEPLMEKADLTCVGINGRVLLDCDIQKVVLDFQKRQVYEWGDEDWDYRFFLDPALVEYCIIHHAEDWVNEIFLSCRFEAQRKGPYNEYIFSFFQCLSLARIQYAENYYMRQGLVQQQLWESDGYLIQRRCPHQKADLARFSQIEDGVLTCTLHGWQFELATGRSLTSEGYRLYTQPIASEETTTVPSGESVDPTGDNGHSSTQGEAQLVRTLCKHCWYTPSRWPEGSKL
jgi:UDP-MurNAc hydroxylase